MVKAGEGDLYSRKYREILGVILFSLGLFLALALISYTPDDLSILKKGLSGEEPVGNLVGKAGAGASEALFWALGLGAFLIPFLSFLYAFRLFLAEAFRFRVLELFSLLVFTLSASGLLALKFKYVHIYSVELSAGGVAGILAYLLHNLFNQVGSYIVLSAILVISAMSTGFFSLSWLFSLGPKLFSGARAWFKRGKKEPRLRAGRARLRAEPALKLPPEREEIQIQARPEEVRQEEFPFARKKKEFLLPPLSLLDAPPEASATIDKEALLRDSRILEKKLGDFGVEGKVTEVQPGPVITLFEFVPAAGVKVHRILNLADDLALALRAVTVRIVAPIPGKAAVGIEIPNHNRQTVFLRELISSPQFADDPSRLKLALGKEMSGRPFVASLAEMPHLLVAGSTGAGKSIFINCAVLSILYQSAPWETKLILIDPKRLELFPYDGMPHLLMPVITDTRKAAGALKWAVQEMEQRYIMLTGKGAKNVESYNQSRTGQEEKLPYIIVVIDELADLMMAAAREVEASIARLAQMARAAGIHLIVATQRPSVDVLTGLIKANFPARISFQVPSRIDSRTILDVSGAEQLIGKGDMLFLAPGTAYLTRVHGCYVSEQEVKKVVEYLKRQGGGPSYKEIPALPRTPTEAQEEEEEDEKYQEAVALVMETAQVSISMIQRRLRIGFNRAARIIERMEAEGLISKAEPGKPREILVQR